jgi:NACHT domain
MIDEVAVGVLTNAITATGRLLGTSLLRSGSRRTADDVAVSRWFDTYRLTERILALPELSPEETARLTDALRQDEIQAVLYELLAARLIDAPETDVNRIRASFDLTVSTAAADMAGVASVLFKYYDNEVCALVGRLEGAEPAILAQIRGEAAVARMIAILHAIERHLGALSGRADFRTETDFLGRYRRHVTEHHGRIVPPDFERRRRVPIADLYVPPGISELMDSEPGWPPREISLWALADDIDRTVLLGDPGGGKTTAANAIMSLFASDTNRPAPFLVTLREFAANDPPERSVTGYLEHRLETFYQCQSPPGIVSLLLLTGRALVIFDGLDELLDSSRRAEITEIIERFATEYPLARLLVTSRLIGYDQARLDDRQFRRYRIGGFTDDQVTEYVYKWFSQEDAIGPGEAERSAEAFIGESSANRDLRANPLMLALMCILYRGEGSLPRNRSEVYEQCANLLFRKWDARRRIHLDLRAGHLLEPALRHLAWWLFTHDQAHAAVTERELVGEIAAFLHGRGFEAEDDAREAATEFVDFCKGRMWVFSDVGTTATGETLYSFTHRTFLEYFAAAQLAYKCDTPERLARSIAPHIARNEWEVVGELAVQIKDHTSDRGAQRVYVALINERRRRSASGRSGVLQFLARCLRSVDPSPQIVRHLSRQVLDHLLAGNPDHKAQYLPVSWLAASCANCKEIVHDEVRRRIDQLTESDDRNSCLNGLRMALWLYSSITLRRESDPRLSIESPLAKFWQQHLTDAVRTHATTAISLAETDTGVRYGAQRKGIISMNQALEMPGGLLPFFQIRPTEMFDIQWAPQLESSLLSLMGGEEDRENIDNFIAVAHYVIRNPHPPWVTEVPYPLSGFSSEWNENPNSSPLPELEPMAYLGAAAVLLMAVECDEKALLGDDTSQEFGPLHDLHPYVARRRGINLDQKLPDLRVPSGFQKMFIDWAENKVNFVDQPTQSQRDVQ